MKVYKSDPIGLARNNDQNQSERRLKKKKIEGKKEKRKKTKGWMGQRRWNAPQALQIWFPTSSLLQRGVIPVPQFAQISAPNATGAWILVGWDRGTIRLAFGEPGPTETSAGTSSIKFLVVGTLFRRWITVFLIEFGPYIARDLKYKPAWITDPNKWNDRDADVSANVLGGVNFNENGKNENATTMAPVKTTEK